MSEYLDPLWSSECLLYQHYSPFLSKISNFGHQISPWYMMLCHKDMHPLLLASFITSHYGIRMIRSAPDRISGPLMVNTVSFLPKLLSNFKQNIQFWAPHRPEKCDAVSQGHASIAAWVFPCLPHISKNDWRCPYRILVSSLSNTVCFLPKLLSTFKQYDQFWTPYRPGKCDAVSQGHASIAAWVFPCLPYSCMNDWKCPW